MSEREDLLRPSLQASDSGQKAIYSTTAGYLTAFFGGPFAAIGMGILNSWRLGRIRADALIIVAAIAAALAVFSFLLRPELFGQPELDVTTRNIRLVTRLLALALFGAFWLLHKRYYRGMQLLALAPPNPWPAAIACGSIDLLLTMALLAWFSA
ncbi:MAG: hypothetical protein AB7T20_07835 [Steroidobacteraceae bacterium]